MPQRQSHDSDLEDEDGEPCARHIVEAPLLRGFKMHAIMSYEGSTDPTDHLSKFNRLMLAHRVFKDVKCHVFLITLIGPADEWFKKHGLGSIHSWHQLSSSFERKFIAARKVIFEVNALANIKQGSFETLKTYIKCFKEEAGKTKRVEDGQQLMALQADIHAGSPLWDDLQWRGCRRLDDFISLTGYGATPIGYSAFQPAFSAGVVALSQSFAPSRTLSSSRRGARAERPKEMGQRKLDIIVRPLPEATSHSKRPRKAQVTTARAPSSAAPPAPGAEPATPQHQIVDGHPPVNGRVGTIFEGAHLGSTSRGSQNSYVQALNHDDEVLALAQFPAQMPRMTNQVITFSEDNAQRVHFPHHDPLVIDCQVSNKMMPQILVDNGSSVNILFKSAYKRIGLTTSNLSPCTSTLYGISGEGLIPMGQIKLHVTL
ncbi:uncharacterized protein LOC133779339 [Humulus lupulus]|uniref:uncharacterized protein LOC133779339 n=1 Tax=Humulus lupulus TaxID=3486 RepID=UPI002B40D1EE|nr:uncharacterized protein LOC133779339 [Humulus lupulus]